MISKKADTTLLKELVYLVIGILALWIIFFVAGPRMMGVISTAPDKSSINNFDRLAGEINILLNNYQIWNRENILFDKFPIYLEVPLDINPKLGIKFYSSETEKPRQCKKDLLCMCIAYIEEFTASQGKKPYKCISFENGKDFSFEDTDVPEIRSGLIQGQGFQSYIISIINYKTIDLMVKTIVRDGVISGYIPFERFCSEEYCTKTYLRGNSDSPLGSPFGDGRTIRITSGYKSEGYSNEVEKLNLGFSRNYLNEGHKGIDIVPSENYNSNNDIYRNKRKQVFFAVCNGRAIGRIDNINGNRILLYCNSGHIVTYLHNELNFIDKEEQVLYGQPLGIMGNTGKSSGAHIHFEIKNNVGNVNPLQFIYFSAFDLDDPRLKNSVEEVCQINQCSLEPGKIITENCIDCCYPQECSYSFCPSEKKSCKILERIKTPIGMIE